MVRWRIVLGVFAVGAAVLLSGCGSSGHSSSPGSGAAWQVSMSRTGSFSPGGVGQYSITVSNIGTGGSSGAVSVNYGLPSVFSVSGVGGAGWSCSASNGISCTRTDGLGVNLTYPAINLSVNVSLQASGTFNTTATVAGGGADSSTGTVQTVIGPNNPGVVQHVVIIVQEGRSPDNLFQDATLIGRGADIQNFGYTSGGNKVALAATSLATSYTLANSHSAFLGSCAWVGGVCEMNGADSVSCSGSGCPSSNAAYQYVQDAAAQPYYTMAETYAFGDRMFQTNEGSSFPAHQYLISGASAVCVPGAQCPILQNLASSTSTYFNSDDPTSNVRGDGSTWAGCLAPPSSMLNLIDTSQTFPNSNYSQLAGAECFEHPTLTDVLDAYGLTWRYYAAAAGAPSTAPNAIAHMCQPTGDPENDSCGGADWTGTSPKVVIDSTGTQILTDIQNGQLAAVTWVVPSSSNSDEGGGTGSGPAWVASVVNVIGQSPFWGSTAIIVTWDNWGGWYDHVAPPVRVSGPYANSNAYGMRVPIIFISPFAQAQYVSHQYSDFGSILRFVEQMYGLPQVNSKVGYADTYALGDLSDMYDLFQAPLPFTPIAEEKRTR